MLAVLTTGAALAAPFHSTKYGFFITPPEGWSHASVPGFAAEFFVGPEQGGFRSNLNVLEPVSMNGMTPAALCKANASGIRQAMQDARIVKQQYETRRSVCEITYTATQNGMPLKFYAELHFGRGLYHTLTFTSTVSGFAKWLPAAKTAFASFRATK